MSYSATSHFALMAHKITIPSLKTRATLYVQCTSTTGGSTTHSLLAKNQYYELIEIPILAYLRLPQERSWGNECRWYTTTIPIVITRRRWIKRNLVETNSI